MGPVAVSQPLQLRVFVRKQSVPRTKTASECCRASISGWSSALLLPSIPFSHRTRARYVSPTKDSLSPCGRHNLAPQLNGRRRGWCPRPSSNSGISESTTAKSVAESAASFGDSSEIPGQQQAPLSLLGGEAEDSKSLLDQVRDIFFFAGPALGIWLSGPLMSIIDTAVVGSNGNSLELAALGPGTVFCDYATFIFMFLGIVTTNLIATAFAQKDEEEAAGHLSRLLFISLVCGVGVLLITEYFATPLVHGFVGDNNYLLIPAARLYIQTRALAWPVVLVGMVAQSASLGMQDSWAPLKVLAVATFVNLFGDILLCTVLGYGIGGAAWATVASQYVGCFLMLKALGDKGYNPLAISVPNLTELKHIINLAAPILFTFVSKVALYTIITYYATSLGPISLGAHQVMIGIFHLCTVGGEPLSQTAEAFMPGLIYGSNKNLKKARSLLDTLVLIGACLGVTLGCIAISVPWLFPQIFTSDPAIITQMRSITVPFFLSLVMTTPILPCEGTLVAGRDLKFLGLSVASCFCGSTLLLLIFSRLGGGLSGSWWTLFAFQLTRLIQNYTRLSGSESIFADKESSSGKEASFQVENVAT